MATHEPIRTKADTPATSDSQAAKTEMGQEMALVVYQRLPSQLDDGRGRQVDDFKPMDEKRAMVVAQQSMDVDEPVPLCTVRPESVEIVQEKCQGFPYKEGEKKTRRNRGRPAGSKPAKGNIEHKPALFDGSSGSYSKGDKEEDFEPPTPTRKRRRPAGYKSAKIRLGYVDSSSEGKKDKDYEFEPPAPTRKRGRPTLSKSGKSKIGYVDTSNSSEGRKDKEYDFEPEVSDDDRRKKYACVKGTALARAEEVKKKLPAEIPSLVKCMTHSQVVKGFWLGLPAVFCRKNLPKRDVEIVLEDEEGKTRKTNYLANKMGLSGGWGTFAQQHNLKVGDALVFQLVERTRFKVYILRKKEFTTTDGALGLLSLDTSMENNTSKKKEESSNDGTKSKEEEPVSSKQSSNDSDNLAGKEAACGGIGSTGPDTGGFVPVKSLVNFKIVVGDNKVVSRVVLPDRLRMAYYTLCHARKAFLHRHLPKPICATLATGMIVQTADIAEGIRAASPALEDLVSWKNTLQSFESLGMDVAFMRERVDKLIDLLSTPLSAMEEPEGYAELKLERARLEKQVRDLDSRLSNLKSAVKEMDVELEEMLEVSPEKKRDQAVQKLATAPW